MSEIVINGVTLTKAEAQQYLDGMSVDKIIEARKAEIHEKKKNKLVLLNLPNGLMRINLKKWVHFGTVERGHFATVKLRFMLM